MCVSLETQEWEIPPLRDISANIEFPQFKKTALWGVMIGVWSPQRAKCCSVETTEHSFDREKKIFPLLRRKANRFKGNFLTEYTHLPHRGRYNLAVKIINFRSLSSKDLPSEKGKLELFFPYENIHMRARNCFQQTIVWAWKQGNISLYIHFLQKAHRYARVLMFRCTVLRSH